MFRMYHIHCVQCWMVDFEGRIRALALYECKITNDLWIWIIFGKFGFLIRMTSTSRYTETKIDYAPFGPSNQLQNQHLFLGLFATDVHILISYWKLKALKALNFVNDKNNSTQSVFRLNCRLNAVMKTWESWLFSHYYIVVSIGCGIYYCCKVFRAHYPVWLWIQKSRARSHS